MVKTPLDGDPWYFTPDGAGTNLEPPAHFAILVSVNDCEFVIPDKMAVGKGRVWGFVVDNKAEKVTYWGQLLCFGKVRISRKVVLVRAFKQEGSVRSTEVRPDQLKAGLVFHTYDELSTAMKGVVDKQKL